MTAFIQDRRNGVPDNKKDQASMRANLTKEFARPDITWKVFCKGLKFMQIVRIHFIIEAEHANGRKTQHSTNVYFGGRADVKEFMDDIEREDDPDPVIEDDPRLPQLSPKRSEDSHG